MSPGRVTIREVAAAAGVSRQTVSNALIHPERLKAPTLERVHAVIDELGYRPSNAAQSLRSQRSGAVGFELNSLGVRLRNEVIYPFTVALGEMAIGHGCHLVTFSSLGAASLVEGYADMVRAQLVDAFVLADTHPGDPRPDYLESVRVPYAAFGRIWGRPDITSWADVDGASGLSEATDHLLDAGYESIGFLGWPVGSAVGDDRRRGWAESLAAGGRPLGAQANCEQDLSQATAAASGLLDAVGRGGAIACASDLLAVGVERAARARGWTPGPDVGITGFDDSGMAQMLGITTLAQPLTEIADFLLGLVHKRLEGGPAPDAGTLFRPSLLVRASTTRTT